MLLNSRSPLSDSARAGTRLSLILANAQNVLRPRRFHTSFIPSTAVRLAWGKRVWPHLRRLSIPPLMNAMSEKMTTVDPKKKRQVLSLREEHRKGMGQGAGVNIRTSISQACMEQRQSRKQQQQQQQPVCRRQKKVYPIISIAQSILQLLLAVPKLGMHQLE